MKPEISVIIPTFNRDGTLPDAVNSVLKQTGVNFEIIVVDDCSDKSAAASLVEAGISDSRIRVIRHEKNQGQAAARNTGALHARGKWLCLLDDDDTFRLEKLSRQLNYMEEKKLRVSVTDFTLPEDQHLFSSRNSEQDPKWLILTARFLALPSTMMIEAGLYREMGGFDASGRVRRTEDLDFALKLYERGHPLKVMPAFLSHYSGFHPKDAQVEINAIRAIEEAHRVFLKSTDKTIETIFDVGIKWKISCMELTERPTRLHGIRKLGALLVKHPIYFMRLALSLLGNPLHRVAPPPDRPKVTGGTPFTTFAPSIPH